MRVVLALVLLFAVVGCARPRRPDSHSGVTFDHPLADVHQSTISALLVNGFEIRRTDEQYIQGLRKPKMGLLIGSGGETVGVWLEPLGPRRTRVQIDTVRSPVGIIGQRKWDDDVLLEIERDLAKKR